MSGLDKHDLEIEECSLGGVLLVKPRRFSDRRGFFSETWSRWTWEIHGIATEFVQETQAFSSRVGTIEGLHFQAPPRAQSKLVRCGRGRLLYVAVDIRKGSPTFGKWAAFELSHENGCQLLVPEGFLHGFATLEDETEIICKCSDFHVADSGGAVRFDDPDIGIDWGMDPSSAILSEKDAEAQFFDDFDSPFTYGLGP